MLFNQPDLRGVAQLVAYLNGVQVVAGSSPVAPTETVISHLLVAVFGIGLKLAGQSGEMGLLYLQNMLCKEKES